VTNEICDKKNGYDEANGYECSFQLPMTPLVEVVFKESNGFAEPHNGVGQFGWVAKE
jgi:hypothetical protein